MGMTDYVTVTSDAPGGRTGAIKLHGPAAFAGMHRAGRLAAETLDMIAPHMVPGVTHDASVPLSLWRNGHGKKGIYC